MASSGSFTGSIRDGHYTLKVSWTQTKNVANNQSTVKATMYLINDWSLSVKGRSDNTCTIAGLSGTYESPSVSSTGTHTLGSVSKTVNHNNDGTKSLTISAVYFIRATLSGTYYEKITASATITLDSIPRASTVSASNVNLNAATTISITRAASSFTHTLSYSFGSQKGTIVTKTDKTSVSWTPPLSLASQIPNAVSGTCTITCDTYSGTTKVGSDTCTLKLTVPSSVKPTITSLTATRVDGDVPSTWGIYVQSKSKATLTINGAAGSYGSTISSYSITGGGFSSTASSYTTGFLTTSGTITFTAKVKDSRGRTSDAATVSITVVAYSAPSFSSYLSQRSTSGGTVSDAGTYIRGLVSYSYASCSSKNTITRATYYKKSSVSSWTNASKSFSSGTAFTFGGGAISTEYSYDVKYTLTDAFTTVTIYDTISTSAVLVDFKAGGKGLAVGKVAEKDNTFEIAFVTEHMENIIVEKSAPRVTCTNGTNAVSLHLESGGVNRGIYDETEDHWLVYQNAEGANIPEKLYLEGHSTPVGTVADSSSTTVKSCANATWTDTNSFVSVTAGVYVISANLNFAAATAKRRGARIQVSLDGGITYSILLNSQCLVGGSTTNQTTRIQTSGIMSTTSSDGLKIKLQAYQDTGAAINITSSYLRVVRIA